MFDPEAPSKFQILDSQAMKTRKRMFDPDASILNCLCRKPVFSVSDPHALISRHKKIIKAIMTTSTIKILRPNKSQRFIVIKSLPCKNLISEFPVWRKYRKHVWNLEGNSVTPNTMPARNRVRFLFFIMTSAFFALQ